MFEQMWSWRVSFLIRTIHAQQQLTGVPNLLGESIDDINK